LNKFEQVRAEKAAALAALGVDPWGGRFDGRTSLAEARKQAPEQGVGPASVRAAGRILGMREAGKAVFLDLADGSGKMQALVGKKQVGEDWRIVPFLDLWDIVGVEGRLGRTRTGEPTIFAERLWMLTKAIAHPPEKYHGAQDVEILLRRRYVDMVLNPEVVARFEDRAKIVAWIREYLAGRRFVEVETPTMQAVAGGAAARPFVTHHNALDLDLYLRIAPELYLKRCLVGGMERVYEIARVFRNEGIDASHNPEFTMLEMYEAYADYHRMMEHVEAIVVGAIERLGKPMKLPFGDMEVDFTPPWPRRTYDELLREYAGCGIDETDRVFAEAERRGIATAGKAPDVVVGDLFEDAVEGRIGRDRPVFVLDYPASLCPLTRRKAANPRVAERFELFAGGMEAANAYTELNDPILQEELFTKQLSGQKEEESMAKMDRDFLLALRHGMPPAGGLGIGVDRLVMLLTGSRTIRDVVLFPLLRPKTPDAAGETTPPSD
jgi:lysyl-tRNA synthetase class 2